MTLRASDAPPVGSVATGLVTHKFVPHGSGSMAHKRVPESD